MRNGRLALNVCCCYSPFLAGQSQTGRDNDLQKRGAFGSLRICHQTCHHLPLSSCFNPRQTVRSRGCLMVGGVRSSHQEDSSEREQGPQGSQLDNDSRLGS
ncbi:hypothetical protein N657DRAFT_644648 [Parathielavia appendiculata]|uniref:Uncharacterized protein n=1 Tax=Parathielavia appendiculata TaxID=2587402 RepID=A0AAN6U151_9PEZI|nr:hypothetical protein N657DRAFT_644648 [Parathielavia appendiculata]